MKQDNKELIMSEVESLTGAEKYWFEWEMKRLRGIKWADHATDLVLIEYALKQLKSIKRFNQPIIKLMEGYAELINYR